MAPAVRAELHDLLIYQPGGHFKKRRDSEKAPGMFGTLVITLPSNHRGGGLSVCHAEQEQTFLSEPIINETLCRCATMPATRPVNTTWPW